MTRRSTMMSVYGEVAVVRVKARLSEIADEVDRTHAGGNITRNGRADVAGGDVVTATEMAHDAYRR